MIQTAYTRFSDPGEKPKNNMSMDRSHYAMVSPQVRMQIDQNNEVIRPRQVITRDIGPLNSQEIAVARRMNFPPRMIQPENIIVRPEEFVQYQRQYINSNNREYIPMMEVQEPRHPIFLERRQFIDEEANKHSMYEDMMRHQKMQQRSGQPIQRFENMERERYIINGNYENERIIKREAFPPKLQQGNYIKMVNRPPPELEMAKPRQEPQNIVFLKEQDILRRGNALHEAPRLHSFQESPNFELTQKVKSLEQVIHVKEKQLQEMKVTIQKLRAERMLMDSRKKIDEKIAQENKILKQKVETTMVSNSHTINHDKLENVINNLKDNINKETLAEKKVFENIFPKIEQIPEKEARLNSTESNDINTNKSNDNNNSVSENCSNTLPNENKPHCKTVFDDQQKISMKEINKSEQTNVVNTVSPNFKPENIATENEAMEIRIAQDLPGYNWLEKQVKIAGNNKSVPEVKLTKETEIVKSLEMKNANFLQHDNEDDEIKILSVVSLRDAVDANLRKIDENTDLEIHLKPPITTCREQPTLLDTSDDSYIKPVNKSNSILYKILTDKRDKDQNTAINKTMPNIETMETSKRVSLFKRENVSYSTSASAPPFISKADIDNKVVKRSKSAENLITTFNVDVPIQKLVKETPELVSKNDIPVLIPSTSTQEKIFNAKSISILPEKVNLVAGLPTGGKVLIENKEYVNIKPAFLKKPDEKFQYFIDPSRNEVPPRQKPLQDNIIRAEKIPLEHYPVKSLVSPPGAYTIDGLIPVNSPRPLIIDRKNYLTTEPYRALSQDKFNIENGRTQPTEERNFRPYPLRINQQDSSHLTAKQIETQNRFIELKNNENKKMRSIQGVNNFQIASMPVDPQQVASRALTQYEQQIVENRLMSSRIEEGAPPFRKPLDQHPPQLGEDLRQRNPYYEEQRMRERPQSNGNLRIIRMQPGEEDGVMEMNRRKIFQERELREFEGKLIAPEEGNSSYLSQKIPRTRDGSLDFGKSKQVDYGFARKSPLANERLLPQEFILSPTSNASAFREPLKRTMFLPGNELLPPKAAKMQDDHRQKFISAELFKKLSEDSKPKSAKTDATSKLDKTCKICTRPAQYLCSGCRKAWYCSQSCQLQEWKSHSKECAEGK